MLRLVSFMVLGSLGVPVMSAAAERAWIDVAVRVYDAAPVEEGDKTRALAVAAAVLAPADLEIHFTHCMGTIAGPPCDRPLGPDELALRLVRSRLPRLHHLAPLPLGDALLDPRRRKGALATIYIERVELLARESRADSAVLLGRAIAHELVHVFSGQTSHAKQGLMRAVWSAWEVAHDRAEDWRLHEADTARLRSRRRPASVQVARR
jgi:hypothetical protein